MWKADLNWLPTSLKKSCVEPTLIFEPPSSKYGGYYRDSDNLIVVVESEDVADTIAHEFCHHLQHELYDWEAAELDFSLPYNQMITKYFRGCRMEFEALLFEYKYAKTDNNDWWLNKLVLNK